MMNLVNENIINLNLKSTDKVGLFREMATMLYEADYIDDIDLFIKALHQREKEASTNIGFGFAIPHARIDVVKKPAIAIGKSRGIRNYGESSHGTVTMILMIAVPEHYEGDYIKILSQISRRLMKEPFREKIRSLTNKHEIIQLLGETESI